jgi:hypothetical protein
MTRLARHGLERLEFLLDEDVLEDTRLCRVLSAARQPTHADELGGLVQARAAFVSTFNPAHEAREAVSRPTGRRTFAGRLLAVKAVAAVSGATLVGGVALAASHTSLLNEAPRHTQNQPAVQTSQPLAPQGSYLISTAVTPAVTGRSTSSAHPAQSHGNSAAIGHAHQSRAPHSHPVHPPSSSPPGKSNPPHRKKPKKQPTQHPSNAGAIRGTAPKSGHANPGYR